MRKIIVAFGLLLLTYFAPMQAATFNVANYGAAGNGTTDDASAVQSAIDAAIKAGPGNTVLVPAGRYLISRQLTIRNASHLTFTGAPGTLPVFVTTPHTGTVLDMFGSDHVVVNGIANDAQVLNFSQGKVTAFALSPPAITVPLDPGYPALDAAQLKTATNVFAFSNPARNAYDGFKPQIKGETRERPGLRTIAVDRLPDNVFVGEKVAVWNRNDNPPGLLYNIGYDSNVTLSNIRDYCGGWNSAGNIYGCDGANYLTNFYEGPPPGTNRLITSGGGMVGSGRGALTLTGCNFSQIDDDCVDLGNSFDPVISQSQPNVITISNTGVRPGDAIQVWSWASGDPYIRNTATVTKAEVTDTGHGRFGALTLDRPVTILHPDPANAGGGSDGFDVVEDTTACGAMTFLNCQFQSDRARGMLLHPSGPLTIKHCKVYGCRWEAVFIGVEQETREGAAPSKIVVTDSTFFGDDGMCCYIGFDNGYQIGQEKHVVFPSVTVSGNRFEDNDLPNSSIGANPGVYDHPAPLVVTASNAPTITGNFFKNNWGPNIFLQSDDNAVVTNNTFVRPNEIQGWPEANMPTNTVIGADLVHGLTLSGNVVSQAGPYTAMLFHASPSVTNVIGANNGIVDIDKGHR